jgi:hypothetical protein
MFGIFNFGHCDLFGICDLLFEILVAETLYLKSNAARKSDTGLLKEKNLL